MKCPLCDQDVARLPDGSLAMHGRPDGSLCPGTNCVVFQAGTIAIGCGVIPIARAWIDPDESPIGSAEEGRM